MKCAASNGMSSRRSASRGISTDSTFNRKYRSGRKRPPDGRIPPLTPEAEKTIAAKKEYLEALLQGTSGGRPGPISPRRSERPPDYNLDRMNRSDGPEDRGGPERCFGSNLPILAQSGTFGGDARIVQTPTAVGITILPCRDPIDVGRREAMSYSISTLLTRNLSDVFGENDPARRRAAIEEIFTEDCVFYEPRGVYYGRNEIDRVAGAIKDTHPDFRYQPIAEPEEIGNGGRVQWVSGRPGEPPAYAGTDFIIARDGRIAAIYLFFDKLP